MWLVYVVLEMCYMCLQDSAKRDELLKPTNPAAQRAALASDAQLKVGGQSLTKLKPKPLHTIASTGKVSQLLIINKNIVYV